MVFYTAMYLYCLNVAPSDALSLKRIPMGFRPSGDKQHTGRRDTRFDSHIFDQDSGVFLLYI